jgi:hypothetical protein
MTKCGSRKQARRFWGAMGAAMRLSSRRPDTHSQTWTASVTLRDNSLREIAFDARLAR